MEAALHDADYAAFLRSEAEREERLEFHDGTIVRRGGNSIAHQRLCTRLTGLLLGHLEGREGQALAAPKLRVEATNRTLAPDLVVVCGPISRSAIDPEALSQHVKSAASSAGADAATVNTPLANDDSSVDFDFDFDLSDDDDDQPAL